MRWVWIFQGQLAGTTDAYVPPDQSPQGFLCVEAPELPDDQLYWDGERVRQRPPRPSEQHFWDSSQNEWVGPPEPEPVPLDQAIAQQQRACAAYWGQRITALVTDYPPAEMASWSELRREALAFASTEDLDQGPNLYREAMLRAFGPVATPDYCTEFRAENEAEAVELTEALAQRVLDRAEALLGALTQLKGLRGYHWDKIGESETAEEALAYDFTAE